MVTEKRKGMKASVVLAAMVVVIAAALVPAVTATVNLDITPDTGIAGERAAYMVDVATGEYDCVIVNVTMPPGFGAIAPTTGDFGGQWGDSPLIATAYLYGVNPASLGDPLLATVKFTANKNNPTTKMNVSISDGGAPANFIISVDYNPGGETYVGPANVRGMNISGHVTLPTETRNGYLNATIEPPTGTDIKIDGVKIVFGKFVQNPTEEGLYLFTASATPCGGGNLESGTATIHIRGPAPLPALTPIGLIALVGLLSVVLVGATVRRKK